MSYTTTPEQVFQLFTVNRGLHRRLADGTFKTITNTEGGRLSTTFKGERLAAVDIVWCLHYGSWPMFPLVQLDGDIHNLDLANIMPARIRQIRCRLEKLSRGYSHPFSAMAFATPELARKHWAVFAKDHYMTDLHYVLELERVARERRAATLAEQPALRPEPIKPGKPRGKPFARTPKPGKIDGRVWFWRKDVAEWLSIPESCHVADDMYVRAHKVLKGAVEFAYDPASEQVIGYDSEGQSV